MTIANSLTLSRIFFIPLVILLIYFGHNFWAAILFLALSLLDALDGYFARKLNQVTDFGKLMDPIADKLLVICTLIVLVERQAASSIPVMIIAAREIFISGFRAHKAMSGMVIAASIAGKVKTVLQIAAVLMLILSLPFAEVVLWLAVCASLYSGAEYIGRS